MRNARQVKQFIPEVMTGANETFGSERIIHHVAIPVNVANQ
jgi:hypothetical protein